MHGQKTISSSGLRITRPQKPNPRPQPKGGVVAADLNASPRTRLQANDNVMIGGSAWPRGQECVEQGIRVRARVPAGHKIAARRIAAGEPVKKYDTVIGAAQRDIEAGEHVHS